MKHRITYSILTDEHISEWETIINNNIQSLILYSDQLLWWNKKINVVSRDVSHETVVEHIKHSLLLSTLYWFKKAEKIIDTGSGGGLPGIPLAMCFPEKQFILNDIVSKKVMAMKQIGFKLKLANVKTAQGSIEKQRIEKNQLVVTKHTFKVDVLVKLMAQSNWKTILFLKGVHEAELEIHRLNIPISCNIIEIDASVDDPFYKEKAIVEVKRKDE